MIRATTILMIVGLLVLPVVLTHAAGAECETASDTGSDSDIDIGKTTATQTMKTRVEFAEKCGIDAEKLRYVMQAKGRLGRIEHNLSQEAEQLAVALGSDTLSDDEKLVVAERYLALREESLAQYSAIEEEIVKVVGADENPLAMGALIILGAADSGKRPTCAVRSPVSGGAGTDVHGTHGAGQGSLKSSFGFGPPRGDRNQRWRSWWQTQGRNAQQTAE